MCWIWGWAYFLKFSILFYFCYFIFAEMGRSVDEQNTFLHGALAQTTCKRKSICLKRVTGGKNCWHGKVKLAIILTSLVIDLKEKKKGILYFLTYLKLCEL